MIGIVSGAGCASLALLQRGLNVSGLTTAAVSLVTGGITGQLVGKICQTSESYSPRKLYTRIAAILCGGALVGMATNKVIEIICPQYSVVRAITVIAVGYLISSMADKSEVFTGSILFVAGMSMLVAGAILFGASGIHFML